MNRVFAVCAAVFGSVRVWSYRTVQYARLIPDRVSQSKKGGASDQVVFRPYSYVYTRRCNVFYLSVLAISRAISLIFPSVFNSDCSCALLS
jgi:hypothetical protein